MANPILAANGVHDGSPNALRHGGGRLNLHRADQREVVGLDAEYGDGGDVRPLSDIRKIGGDLRLTRSMSESGMVWPPHITLFSIRRQVLLTLTWLIWA